MFLAIDFQGYSGQRLQQEDHTDQGNFLLHNFCWIALYAVSLDCDSDNLSMSIQVDSANKRGSLLEVVQVLTDMNLIIRRAYISSDGEWFMDGESLNLNPLPVFVFLGFLHPLLESDL